MRRGTHERLKAHLRELIEPKIGEHRGRIVKNTGDGFLAEFASVVDAVRCAVEVQWGMVEREAETPDEKRITFRVGINLGDVIAEEHDIFGDGVNVAARLEALAAPGGVLVSNTVYEHVRDRLPFGFEDVGEQQVKNIARPVRVYALCAGAVADLPASTLPPSMSISQPAVAPRLSIVVLPFANLSNDPEQQYFTDGITEDLTTDLSRIAGMFVISRNTAFTYRNNRIDTKQIGRELGVRYVLEGSVRRSGNRVRVSAQLIDAEIDAHLWADRFDRDTEDLFALQDEIVSRLANALGIELIAAEAARPSKNPDALDYILRGRAVGFRQHSRDSYYVERINLFERALALDPLSVEAQTRLAAALVGRVFDGVSASAAADLATAEGLVGQALTTSPRYAHAHVIKGRALSVQNRWEEAIPEYEMALALNRNSAAALQGLGQCKLIAGPIDEAISLAEEAIRLSPRDPYIGYAYFVIGAAHLLESRTAEAIVWLEKARSAMPAVPMVRSGLASAYALRGETERAAIELAEARRLNGGDTFSSIAKIKAQPWGVPKTRALFEATYFAGLRKAGVPEE